MNPLMIQGIENNIVKIQKAFDDCQIKEINIYNQAFLIQDRPLLKTANMHPVTKYELPLVIPFKGDISGRAICLLDTFDKEIQNSEKAIFQSLYTEGMNILLGQYFTELERASELTSLIGAPKIINMEKAHQLIEFSQDKMNYQMGYTLISNFREFDCRIYFILDHTKEHKA